MGYLISDGIADAANNLQGIGLENFRTFKEYNSLNFSSINLITGVNGSGKSSIFKAILLLKDSLQYKEGDINLDFSRQEHLLGTFNNVVHDKSSKNIKMSISMPFGGVKSTYIMFDFEKKSDSLAVLKKVILLDNEVPLITLNKRKPNETEEKEFYDYIDNIPIGDEHLESIIDYEIDIQKLNLLNDKLKKVHDNVMNIFRDGVVLFGSNSNLTQIEQNIANFNKNDEGLEIPKNRNDEFYQNDLIAIQPPQNGYEQVTYTTYQGENMYAASTSMLNVLIKLLTKYCYIDSLIIQFRLSGVLSSFSNVSHLSSIRGINSRLYHFNSNNPFIKLLNQYNENTFEKTFINTWLKKLKIGEAISIKKYSEFEFYDIKINVIENGKKVSRRIIDFGYGIGQIITLLIYIGVQAGGYNKKPCDPSTIIIEEPEANLHPNWQSKLAEIIIEASQKFSIQFLIETHSEYLIYKFQELIGNRKIRPTDIALYYLNHPKSGEKYVNYVPFGIDGQIDYQIFKESAFFDVQNDLKLSLLNIQRDRFLDLFETNKARFGKEGMSNEELLEKLEGFIDEHFDKLDYRTYEVKVKSDFPNYNKLQPNTQRYLAIARHLMELYDNDDMISDYSSAVIQMGRAVECEFMYLFKCAKDYILNLPDYSENWTKKEKYKVELDGASISYGFKHDFKNFIINKNDNKYKISFGQSKQALILMMTEDTSELNKVNILKRFNYYLENECFDNWNNIKISPADLTFIVDLRNKAAHTYNDEQGENRVLQNKAIEYKDMIEPYLKIWSKEIKIQL
jgi:predicted ATPase